MAGRTGPAFYDDDAVFETYMTSRERVDNPNRTLEQPVIREMAGILQGQRVLDLGCGAAEFGQYALECGATSYLGIDGSRKMIATARRTLASTSRGTVQRADLASWVYPEAAFDLVISSLALHYLPDLEPVFADVYRTLVPGGRFVFSVEHPVITSSSRGWQSGNRQAWLVDDYFVTGPRETIWLGNEVIKHHRTVEDHFRLLQETGFVVEQLRESRPRPELFADLAEYERRRRIPLFLFLAGCKPETDVPYHSG